MQTQQSSEPRSRVLWKGLAIFAAAFIITLCLGLLIVSIFERRQEAALPPQLLVPPADLEPDNAKWGMNFPMEYESWRATSEGGALTKHGGPQAFSHLSRDPLLVDLFNGYPFAVEYNDDRGHMHAIDDVRATARRDVRRGGKPQPGTCMTCKSSDVPKLMAQMGGPGKFYQADFEVVNAQVSHPIGCADCHDAGTMGLRISRPALRDAFVAMGKSIDDASHQEMRSLVCAQCHVEYYFAKQPGDGEKGTYLALPWKRGTSIEAIAEYYTRDVRHVDWVHPVSKTAMVKMQHPDYELFQTGIHAQTGVSCADCHMPYRSEGGRKYTDHHVQSPLKNISNSCAVCHRGSEQEMVRRVEQIQDRNRELLNRAEEALVAAHNEVGAAMQAGATEGQLREARELIRGAQMRWDFVAANNGMGFHSPQESARILGAAIDLAQQARVKVAKL